MKLDQLFNGLLIFAFALSILAHPSFAQDKKVDSPKTKKEDEEKELPKPERIALTTKDGVSLSVNWYGGIEGKKTPPIILLHDFAESSRDFTGDGDLAPWLQAKGFAVLAPDLRGHGNSKNYAGTDGKEIDIDRMRKKQLALFLEDLETCKRFLMKKNNEGKLNIELLSILAVGKMSVFAADYTIRDWSFGRNSKGVKLGKDVKALILVSPEKTFKGFSLTKSIKADLLSGKQGIALPMFFVTGGMSSSLKRQTNELRTLLERSRGKELSKKTLNFEIPKTKYQGAELANVNTVKGWINGFVDNKVLSKKDSLSWQDRSKK